MKRRETCLRCEQAGERTALVQTDRFGGVCPVHDAKFLSILEENARARLGLRRPVLAHVGIPTRRNG